MKILVINGPNLNLLGLREPEIYGKRDYAALCGYVRSAAAERGMEADFYQSNHEGDLVDAIQQAYGVYDGIVINPAAYTHTSVALPDAVKAVSIPTVEVHLSHVDQRESFRQISYIRAACIDAIWGHGFDSYIMALDRLQAHFAEK